MAGAPGRSPLDQLGPRERDHEQRVVPRPLEQVLDEVEQRRVRPLHVLEGEHGRVGLGQPLEEQPPGREQILPVARLVLAEAEQLREPRLDEAAARPRRECAPRAPPAASASAVGGSSSSAIRQRIRTMSASAQ